MHALARRRHVIAVEICGALLELGEVFHRPQGGLRPRRLYRLWDNAFCDRMPVASLVVADPRSFYQTMAEDHVRKSVGECHPYKEFEGMQPSI
jgi:hypothetical protein